MKGKKINETMKNYQIPKVPNSIIDETVRLAKLEFEQTPIEYKMSFRDLFIGQIKYISPYIWIAQVVLLLIVSSSLVVSNNTNDEYKTIMTILSAVAPILALVAIPELAKSFNYNMWEIESTSKFNLQKIIVIRLIIIGIIDLFVMTIMIIITYTFYEMNIVNIILYMLVPFNFANSIYLFILRKIHGKTVIFSCLIVGFSIAFGLGILSNFNEWYVLGSTYIWGTLFVFSVFMLAHEIIHLLKPTQREEELLWNY